jgi:hypothetical protein
MIFKYIIRSLQFRHTAHPPSHMSAYFLTILPITTRIAQPLNPLSDHQPQLCSSSCILHSKHINPCSIIQKIIASAAAKTTKPARIFESSPTIFPPTTRIPQPSSHYPTPPTFPLTTRTPQPSSHNHHPTTIIPQPSSHNHHPTTIIPQPSSHNPKSLHQPQKPPSLPHIPPSTFHHLSPPLTSPTSHSLTSPHLTSSPLSSPPFPSFHPQQTSCAPRHDHIRERLKELDSCCDGI